jgi:REP element-mobilizing transposase RayT
MSRYRRARIEGGVFFFTVTLADRSSDLLVRHIERLRRIYASVQRRRSFETVAICILPDHIRAIWQLPQHDSDFPLRCSLIKSGFSRGLALDAPPTASKTVKRERGLWQRRYWEHAIRDDADFESRRLHTFQSRKTRARQSCRRLAVQQFQTICRARRPASRLGRRYEKPDWPVRRIISCE